MNANSSSEELHNRSPESLDSAESNGETNVSPEQQTGEIVRELEQLEQEIVRQEQLRQQLIDAMSDERQELESYRAELDLGSEGIISRNDFPARIDQCTASINRITRQKRVLLGLPSREEFDRNQGIRGERLRMPQTEVVVENRQHAVSYMREMLREALRQHYGVEGSELPFHNLEHAERIAGYSREILQMIQEIIPEAVTEEDFDVLELEAYAHDVIQMFEGGSFRLRKRGDNEVQSGELLGDQLDRFRTPDGEPVFSVSRDEVVSDIRTTQPEAIMGVRLDDETTGPMFFQPHLQSESSLRGFALAISDLRGPYGREYNPQLAFGEGDKEFRELNIGVSENVARGVESLSAEERGHLALTMLEWWQTQEGFIRWQGRLMPEVLNRLMEHPSVVDHPRKEELRQQLETSYQHFEANGRAARQRLTDIEDQLSIHELRQQFRDESNRRVAQDLEHPTAEEEVAIREKIANIKALREQNLTHLSGLSVDQVKFLARQMGYRI